jgi:hypothetical protein
MKATFGIGLEPTKRNKVWVVSIYINLPDKAPMLDSEHSFKTKRDAKLFIEGWKANCECNNRN